MSRLKIEKMFYSKSGAMDQSSKGNSIWLRVWEQNNPKTEVI
jgi:hypothetical protein